MSPRTVAAVLVTVDALLVLVATRGWTQDFLPYYTGAALVRDGRADVAMLPAGAAHLFDGAPAFVERAQLVSGADPSGITGLVTAPPALLPALALAGLPYAVAALLWKLGMAAVCIGALHALHRRVNGSPEAAFVALLLLPGLAYCVLLGQTTPLLVGAAAFALWPRVEGAFLGLATVFKLWPAVVLVAASRASRVVAVAVVVVATLLALALPTELWTGFAATASHLTTHTTSTPENVSVEAGLLRLVAEPTAALVPIPPAFRAIGWALRLLAAGVLARALRRGAGATAAAWVLALWASPLSWGHYLAVLPFAAPRWRVAVAAIVAVAHVGVFVRPPGLGHVGTLCALIAGGLVLRGAWTAERA